MRFLSRTTKLLTATAAVAAAVAVGVTAGLLGGAVASTAAGSSDSAGGVPSAQRLHAAAASIARTTHHDTVVAQAESRAVPLFHRPGGGAYTILGPLPGSYATRPVFRVLGLKGGWLHVALPTRPNHSTAWIRARDVRVATTDYRIDVRLSSHRLVLYRGTSRVLGAPIAVGKALTPTPDGTYFIAYVLRTTDPQSFFGPYAFGLSAYSNVLTSFAGGDGEIGLHGTSEPWLLGRSVSHGCIRIGNAVIARLVHLLPLGTPVLIEH